MLQHTQNILKIIEKPYLKSQSNNHIKNVENILKIVERHIKKE